MQKISLFYLFWRYGWSKTPAIWLLRTFWPISQEQKISQVQNLNRKKSNNINFHYWSNLIKINEQIFQQIKKTLLLAHFGPIFQILRLKKMFPENLALPHSTSHAILIPYQNLEKMTQFQENAQTYGRIKGWMEWWKDRHFRLPLGIQ